MKRVSFKEGRAPDDPLPGMRHAASHLALRLARLVALAALGELAARADTGSGVAPRPIDATSLAAGAPAPAPRCYVALLHGSGPDLREGAPDVATLMERYWNPARDPAFTLSAQEHRADAVASHCLLFRVGFDGGAAWWDERAAGAAARALHGFIRRAQIPDGRLVLVGHSMGGIVARYLVNNGAPDAPYFNEHVARDPQMDYALVRRKTALVITVATPHTGTEAADALAGQADHRWGNAGASLLRALGLVRDSAANASLTRAVMEAASAPGGDLGDDGRTIPIFTVAGISADGLRRGGRDEAASEGLHVADAEATGAGQATRADRRLALAWSMLCTRPSAWNLWGLACGHRPWGFPEMIGDGVVSRASAHGAFTRDAPAERYQRAGIAGALAPWADRPVNHSQSRYSAQSWAVLGELLARQLDTEPGR